MHAASLDDRGAVDVDGLEAGDLLQRLFTNDVLGLAPGQARYAALLSPQGKILVDFLVVARLKEGMLGYMLDCPRVLAPDLAKKLNLYKLRAKVAITDRRAEIGIAAFWPDRPDLDGLVYGDPRSQNLGFRVAATRSELAAWIGTPEPDLYRETRIRCGIPEGGVDFIYGETFPHEANLDRIHGVDFTKGCYVGQEVVSRVEHRGTARKRITQVSFRGERPPPGADILVGDIAIGVMGSATAGQGLAMIRIDRASEAAAVGATVMAGGTPVMIALP